MSKKKKTKPELPVKSELPVWEIDWDKVKTFEDIHDVNLHKLKLILESPVGNEIEDDDPNADLCCETTGNLGTTEYDSE